MGFLILLLIPDLVGAAVTPTDALAGLNAALAKMVDGFVEFLKAVVSALNAYFAAL